jgi:hypothetical protein
VLKTLFCRARTVQALASAVYTSSFACGLPAFLSCEVAS